MACMESTHVARKFFRRCLRASDGNSYVHKAREHLQFKEDNFNNTGSSSNNTERRIVSFHRKVNKWIFDERGFGGIATL
jgi:hypothetical protein